MHARFLILLPIACLAAPSHLAAGETVALRTARGTFLRTADDHSLPADRWLPGPRETFQITPLPGGCFAVQACDGRLLTAVGHEARQLRADSPRTAPGERETFVATTVAPGQQTWKVRGYRENIRFDADPPRSLAPPHAAAVAPGEVVEVYRLTPVPPAMLRTLSTALASLVAAELNDKPYDTTQTRKHEQTLKLPAPTLKNLRATRQVTVLATEEQYHLTAQLDGAADIQLTQMANLKAADRPGLGVMLFALEATFPVRGRVQYRVPNVVDAATGYRTSIAVGLLGELQMEKTGDTFSLRPAAVRDVRIELRRLDISNDVLQVFHRQIRELINHEIRHNQPRIESQANDALAKAVSPAHLQSDFLQFIEVP